MASPVSNHGNGEAIRGLESGFHTHTPPPHVSLCETENCTCSPYRVLQDTQRGISRGLTQRSDHVTGSLLTGHTMAPAVTEPEAANPHRGHKHRGQREPTRPRTPRARAFDAQKAGGGLRRTRFLCTAMAEGDAPIPRCSRAGRREVSFLIQCVPSPFPKATLYFAFFTNNKH